MFQEILLQTLPARYLPPGASCSGPVSYIRECAAGHWSKTVLRARLREDMYNHQGRLPNNSIVGCEENVENTGSSSAVESVTTETQEEKANSISISSTSEDHPIETCAARRTEKSRLRIPAVPAFS
jgi:aspartyl-tRNA synthetase